jgi:hypothetical protein
MTTGMFVTGLDFICASLTLAYIGRLLFQQISVHGSMGAMYSPAKISLQGQHVARRLR